MNLQLYIGQMQLRGAISKYAAHYNLLEFRGDARRVPRTSVLQRWRAEVANSFVFAWLLDREIGRLSGDCTTLVQQAISSARALEARWLVLQTDPTVGPSQRTRERLGALFSRLIDSGMRLAWEPHGIWQADEAVAFARELGAYFVQDISRGDATNERVVYSRLPGLGTAARLSIGALERSAKNLASASEAYIAVAGDGARKLKEHLPGIVSGISQLDMAGTRSTNSVQVFGGFSAEGTNLEPNATSLDDENTPYDEGDDDSIYDDDDSELADDEPHGGCAYDSEDDDMPESEAGWDEQETSNRASGSNSRSSQSRDESSRGSRKSR